MTVTFTSAQFSFTAAMIVKASQLTYNFDCYRGGVVPVSESTRLPVSDTYDLGNSVFKWRFFYGRLAELSYGLGLALITIKPLGVTTGQFDLKVNASTIGVFEFDAIRWVGVGAFASTQTANLSIRGNAETTGGFDFKIGSTTAISAKANGIGPLSVAGVTSTTHLSIFPQPTPTSGVFDVKIGGTTAAAFAVGAPAFGTLTLNGITTTTNFTLGQRPGITDGAFDFQIGGVTRATIFPGIAVPGITATSTFLIAQQPGYSDGAFDVKFQGATIAVLTPTTQSFVGVGAEGVTTTAHFEIIGGTSETTGAFSFKLNKSTTILSMKIDGVARKARFKVSGTVSDDVHTATARQLSGAVATLTCSGFPILVTFCQANANAGWLGINEITGPNSQTAWFNLLRNGTTIGRYELAVCNGVDYYDASRYFGIRPPMSAFKWYDFSSPAGVNTYAIQCGIKQTISGSYFSVTNCAMLVIEL